MLINAVMMLRQRAIVRAFERAAATTAATACTAGLLGLKPGMAWHRLVSLAVLRCPGEGRYFLDMENWQRLRRRRQRIALAVITGVLVLLGLLFLAGTLSRPGAP
ncbi:MULTISPECIES: hypothetical protein [Rhodanobacter]|uniref:hypothetical protein n=1 Tax=Rhodanobacter TaxID=75309 RepID=UPI00040D1E83|nr:MULTISPECIES: hypothetical protein [Rhodanobacter]TAN17358.1 MAG: hypothetical protein EPN35_07475 [Rhodanobacter sp.]UJJ55081.1 hypothetical protein LRK53_01355 [Rhodanobacter thiooxydans]